MSPRLLLALLATAYVAVVLAASASSGPRMWGLHLPGFLPGPERALALALLVAGAGLLLWDARTRGAGAGGRPARRAPLPGWIWLPALPLLGAVFYSLRARSFFLGDGIVWLSILRGAEKHAFNEPLAASTWTGFVAAAHAAGLPTTPGTFALLPVLCGIASAAILWGIAGEVAPSRAVRPAIWGLLLSTGAAQLWFGYIESYPVATVPVLAFLWAALRLARGAAPGWLPGLLLALAIASHLSAAALYPAFVVALVSAGGSRLRRVAEAASPLLLAPALLLLLGSEPAAWLSPLRVATLPAGLSAATAHLVRPYAFFSLGHALDVTNAFLLAAPVPAILLLTRGLSGFGATPRTPRSATLAAAAIPGALLAATLMLPVAPAQDWDLSALLLLPFGVAGIAVGVGWVGGGASTRGRAGLLLLSAGALLSFVLVNAREETGARRFAALISRDAAISPYARAYGNGALAEHYEDHGTHEEVFRFARAAVEAEPTNPRYWVKAGAALYNLGRYDEAVRYLTEARRRGPDRADAWNNLGLCYARTGRVTEAIDAFRGAVARDGDEPDYRHNLGVVLYSSGWPDSARLAWAEVLRRWPGYPPTQRSWARRFGAGDGAPPPSP